PNSGFRTNQFVVFSIELVRCRQIAVLVLLASPALPETFEGRVIEDHSSAPVPSADVRFFRTGSHIAAADLETDSQGRFRAEDLLPGEYRLDIDKRNYSPVSVHLTGNARPILVRLTRNGVIAGKVTDSQGEPVKGAH